MNFINIKQNIISILETASASLAPDLQFKVTQGRKQKTSAESIKNQNSVLIFTSTDAFDKSKGTPNGTVQSSPTFRMILQSASSGEATDLNDPDSVTSAEIIVEDKIDNFISQIYLILMNAKNLDLGMPVGQVAGRWVDSFQKSDATPKGEVMIMQAQMDLTCDTPEDVSGIASTVGTTIKTDLQMNGDDTAATGVEVAPQ